MPLGKKLFDTLFACRHRHLSRIVTIQHQTYQVCLDCGARVRYSWQTMSSEDEREPFLRSMVQRLVQAAKQKIAHAISR
jgi:ADP-heptose:LPS heptosyltransferase